MIYECREKVIDSEEERKVEQKMQEEVKSAKVDDDPRSLLQRMNNDFSSKNEELPHETYVAELLKQCSPGKKTATDEQPPTEFSVLYFIERQLNIYWQKTFEHNLKMDKTKKNAKGEETEKGRMLAEMTQTDYDHYMLHAYIIKKGWKGLTTNRRFFVLSKIFIWNVEANFTSEDCSQIEFKSLKWRVPITAIREISIKYDEKKKIYKLTCFFDLAELNDYMQKYYGATKPQKKEKRSLKFIDRGRCRDFLYQLKYLYHLNCVSKLRDIEIFPEPKQMPPIKETLDKK